VLEFLAPFLTTEFGLPLSSSLLTGMLIGLERELQGCARKRWSASHRRC
jgi:hypothetical protein